MKQTAVFMIAGGLMWCSLCSCELSGGKEPPDSAKDTAIQLPPPSTQGTVSVEETLEKRRSIRNYSGGSISLEEVSQLLWAAQGFTTPDGRRTAPSAGALYPLEVFLVAGNVQNLPVGIYRYQPDGHRLTLVKTGDYRQQLSNASLGQRWVQEGAASIVLAAVYERVTRRYGERGIKYTHMEVGHAAQNVCLQVVALNLGTVVVGAFTDDQVSEVIGLQRDERPQIILPIGRLQ